MLIEFNASNYRSIYEKQSLNMTADHDKRFLDSHSIETSINNFKLLNSAAIYGPNAAGKSTLILAIECMRNMVLNSAIGSIEGQPLIGFSPFRFEQTALSEPSEFEIHFIENDIRYQYGFTFNQERIVHEWLYAYVGRKSQRWFEREYDAKEKEYNWYFGPHFAGGVQKNIWKNATRSNALFLSTAVNLNCDQLKSIFYWFLNKLLIIRVIGFLPLDVTLNYIEKKENKLIAMEFLQAADLNITDIEISKYIGNRAEIKISSGKATVQSLKEVELPKVTIFHGKTSFDFSEESQGTQKLLGYLGFFLDALQQGKVLIIDELEVSLHSTLTRFLIKLFHNKRINKKSAQLIFSTHNASLLDNDLFRRDQIWFIEKDKNQASRLYPLTDFKPRSNESLEKGYLQGRYGALPFFCELSFDE